MGDLKENEDILLKKIESITNTLPAFTSSFFRNLRQRNLSVGTIFQYALDIKMFMEYSQEVNGFASMKDISLEYLNKLTREDLEEYLDTIYKIRKEVNGEIKLRSAAPQTTARKVAVLKTFFSYYYRGGFLEHNYAELLDPPKIPMKEIIVLNDDELKRLFDAVKDTKGMDNNALIKHKLVEKRDLAILVTLALTGLRVSELCNIDIGDIDNENKEIRITRKGGDREGFKVGEIPLRYINDYINTSRKEILGENDKVKPLFISLRRKRISVDSVQSLLKKYGKIAHIPEEKLTPHKLRKTAGTNLLKANNGNIDEVATMLHHSSIQTTKKYYALTSEDSKRKSARTMDNVFNDILNNEE